MRCFFLQLLMLLSVSCIASITIDNNMSCNEGIFNKYEIEFISHGKGGLNQVWDFSNVNIVNGNYEVKYSYSDSIIKISDNNTDYIYRFTEDALLWLGYENELSYLIDSIPVVSMKYPYFLGDSISNPFYLKGKYCQTNNIAACGIASVKADGFGSLLLPECDTLRDVTRVHKEYISSVKIYKYGDSSTIDYHSSDTLLQHIEEIYHWYAPEYCYPIVEAETHTYLKHGKVLSKYSRAFICPPREQPFSAILTKYRMQKKPMSDEKLTFSSIVTEDNNGIVLEQLPNGVSISINKELILQSSQFSLLITDIQGRIFKYLSDNITEDKGIYYRTIDTGQLPTGDYIIVVNAGSTRVIRKFTIKI